MIEFSYDPESPELPSDAILGAMREAGRAAARERSIADAEISLSFVSPDAIRVLNREHRGIDEITDVLSFPMDGEEADAAGPRPPDDDDANATASHSPDDVDTDAAELLLPDGVDEDSFESLPPVMLGDIVICPERAREQADEYGHGEPREFVYLFVHGLFHLLGYDHETEDDRAKMRVAEEDIMRRVNL
jgi:probable rRNA maturation factor